MSKQLEKDSSYNQFDTDHDGVVTDTELARSERMLMIENMDKMADQQRIMAWAALVAPPALIAFLASPRAVSTIQKAGLKPVLSVLPW